MVFITISVPTIWSARRYQFSYYVPSLCGEHFKLYDMCDEVWLVNLPSVNTWCFQRPATCIRFTVNDIRALFNIQTFRNRLHIASCDCVLNADDSALYCCSVRSFLIWCRWWLLKRVQRLRIACRSARLYDVIIKVEILVVFWYERVSVIRAAGVSGW